MQGSSLIYATQRGINRVARRALENGIKLTNIAPDPDMSITALVHIPLVIVRRALPHFLAPADMILTVSLSI